MTTRLFITFIIVLMCVGVSAGEAGVPAKLALVPGGDPKPEALLVLSEAKLFEIKDLTLLDRTDINKVLAEQKLTGMFDANNAVELGRILKADIFAVLETTSIVIFDAQTGLRFVDETLPEKIEDAVQTVFNAVKTAVEKREKLDKGNLVTFGVLEVRNVDFPVVRDAWCRAVAGMLERSLLHRGGAVLERSRLQHVNRERQLTGDGSNDLLASMKLVNLSFTRGTAADSFRLTARIGNDTFYAESSFDKPLDAVHGLAEQLLESNVREEDATESAREAEAARFATEAVFLDKIGLLDDALETIEVAAALAPENLGYRSQLLSRLMRQTHARLTKSSNRSFYDVDGYMYFRIEAEAMRQAIQETLRIETLLTSFPVGYVHRQFALVDGTFNRIRSYLTIHADYVHPEFKGEVRSINRRTLNRWLEERYRTALNDVADQRTFQVYLHTLTPPEPQAAADLAAIYAEIIENTYRLAHHYELAEDAAPSERADMRRRGEQFPFADLIRVFAKYVLKFRADNIAEPDPEAAAMIERTLGLMEQDSRMTSQIYAWIARNQPVGLSDRFYDPLMMEEFSETVRAYLADIPKGLPPDECNIIYDELVKIINAGGHLRGSIEGLNSPRLSQLAAILELADSRNEIAVEAVSLYVTLGVSGTRSPNADQTEYLKIKPQIDSIIRRQFVSAERLGEGIASMETWWQQAIIAGIIESPSKDNVVPYRPWTSEIVLFPKTGRNETYTLYNEKTFLRGNVLYCVSRDRADTNKHFLVCINLETFERQHIFLHNGMGRWDGVLQHVDGVNAYVGVQTDVSGRSISVHPKGLFIYPLDGSAPWSLTTAEGVPSNVIRVLGTIGNQCYVVAGDDWIIRIDLKTQEWEQLSSSRAKEGNTPFLDGRQLNRIHFTLDDPKRERIFFVEEGYWSIEKNGTFVQIDRESRFDNRSRPLEHFGGNNVLLHGAMVYDAETGTRFRTDLAYAGSVGVWNGYVWGRMQSGASGFRWGRRKIGCNTNFEPLAVPESITRAAHTFPFFCAPTPDDTGLVVGGGASEIVLLRFE